VGGNALSAAAVPAPDLSGRSVDLAPLLLGAILRHDGVAVRLTEVEAYAGTADPASHAFRGRTPRTEVMFGPAGRLYVYFVYGMHWCANLVTGPDGEAGAVLLRAGAVVDGVARARARRPGASDRDLARGPARLARTLGLTGAQTGSVADLTFGTPVVDVSSGPRVGVSAAAAVPWRFWVTGDPTVSPYRTGGRRVRRPRGTG
jgi:DNA-3-methyladenine glycosylase